MSICDASTTWLAPITSMSSSLFANSTTSIMDADGEQLAFKIYPQTITPIVGVDLCLGIAGTVTDINFRIRIETDNADKPSGTVLGAATPEFAGLAASGWTGLKTLETNTGNLTINTPVWVVFYRSSGASLSASNNVATRGTASPAFSLPRSRHFNGTNWTTTAIGSGRLGYVVKFSDNTYGGIPFTNIRGMPGGVPYIYSNNRQGVRLKFGSQIKIIGFITAINKGGTPNNLVATVFEGTTAKYSTTIQSGAIVGNLTTPFWFESPISLAPLEDVYIVLNQESNGGNASNYYALTAVPFDSTYFSAAMPPDMAFVYGTGDNPTLYTAPNDQIPYIIPLISDGVADLAAPTDAEVAAAVWAYGNRTLTA